MNWDNYRYQVKIVADCKKQLGFCNLHIILTVSVWQVFGVKENCDLRYLGRLQIHRHLSASKPLP